MASLGLINRVKYLPWLYNIYFHIGTAVVRLLKFFVKKDKRLIVFSSFGGRKYDDSPKCIYEAMIKDSRFDGYKIIWAFMQPEKYDIPRGKKVKTDTTAYYKTLLKARCWITNSTMERGLRFKDDSIFYYNSWHGTPIKLMGRDIDKSNLGFHPKKRKICPYDVFCAQGEFDADIFKRSFNIPENAMKIIGLPRNDELVNDAGEERKRRLKKQLGIALDKRVILFAPTFREYTKDENLNCVMAPPIHIEKWKKELAGNYVLLFRAHYEVVKVMNIVTDDFVKDVSTYPLLNDLMIVSDLLISDYSSIFVDYSIMGKPMLCFSYDYDEYQAKRGMYFDIREELDCMGMDTEEKVIREIVSMDVSKRETVSRRFRDKYIENYGSATNQSLDLIFNGISRT